MLRIIDRYILWQITKPLFAAMGIGLATLLAERLVRLLDTTLGKRNSFTMVFELLAYLVPHYLGIALPAALFLGLLFGFSRLSRGNEVDAVLATGTSLARLTRPVLFLSAILAMVTMGMVGWLQPLTRYAYRSVMFDVGNVEVFYLAQEGVFMQSGTRTFILDQLDRSTNSFSKVFMFDNQQKKGLETLTASSGQLISVPNEPRPILELKDGNRLRIDQWPDKANPEPPGAVTTFAVTDAPLGKLSKKNFRARGDDQRELTLPELINQRNNPPAGATLYSMSAELNKRIVNVLLIFVLPVFAIPFAIGRQRNQRGYRFGIALVVVVALHEIIEQGAVATTASGVSPLLTMWLPFALFSVYSCWSFYRAAFTMQRDRLGPLLDQISAGFSRVFSRIGWRRPKSEMNR